MKQHAINPYFVPTVPFLIFMVAFLYPPEHWQAAFNETNHTYLDPASLIFTLTCLMFLYIGTWTGLKLSKRNTAPTSLRLSSKSTFTIVFPVLIATSLVLAAYIYYLTTKIPGYILLTLSGQGDIAKQLIASDEIDFGTLPNFAIPIVWWAWYRHLSSPNKYSNHNLLSLALATTTVLLVAILVINAARFALMPLIIGLFVIYAHLKIFSKTPEPRHLKTSIKIYTYLFISVISIFSLFAIARGASGASGLIEMILGYGPVSFNRLSAALNGDLTLEYSSTGVYLVPEPFFYIGSIILGTQHPSSMAVWLSEFDGVASANLNENFIWLTVFGYTYDTINILSPAYFMAYGAFTAFLWRAFIAGRTHGIVLYPLAYFSIFFFFGYNYFVIFFPYYAFILLTIWTWEKLITSPVLKTRQSHAPQRKNILRSSNIQP